MMSLEFAAPRRARTSVQQAVRAGCLLILTSACTGSPGTGEVVSEDTRLASGATPLSDALDHYLLHKPQQGPMHGTVLLAQGDTILFHRAYGIGDKELGTRAHVDKNYRIASMSKFITAVTLMRAVEQGYIDSAEDLVGQYTPVPSAYADLRISDVLKHVGGVHNCSGSWELGWILGEEATFQEMRENVLSNPRCETGSYRYRDMNYFLAGLVVAEAVDPGPPGTADYRDFYDYIQSELFDPLDMTSAEYVMTQGYQDASFAHVHAWGATYQEADLSYPANDVASDTHWRVGGPYGGFRMTAADYHKLLREVFVHNQLVSASSTALLVGDTVPVQRPSRFAPFVFDATPDSYGYGINIATIDNRVVYYHTGTYTPAWTSSIFMYFPQDDVTIIVLKNVGADWSGLHDATEIAAKLQEIYFAHAAGYDDHLSFVTSARYAGDLGGLAGADEKCTSAAHAAGLRTGSRWRAILSAGNPANENIPYDANRRINLYGPIKNTVGQVVADFDTRLWSPTLLAPNKYDQHGAARGSAPTWTASSARGYLLSTYRDCADWTSPSGSIAADIGYPAYLDFNRMDYYWSDRYCSAEAHLYCVSQTVPGP